MKITKLLLIGIVSLTSLFGCGTKPQPIAITAITDAATIGAEVAINDSPALRPYFQKAHDDLGALLAKGSLDAAQLTTILNELPIKELQGSTARIIITTSLVLFDNYIQQATEIDRVAAIQSVAQSVYTGLDAALAATPQQLKAAKAYKKKR